MRPRTLRVQEMAFWSGVFSGLRIEAAARAIGMAGQTGRMLFREAGGVKPQLEPPALRLSYEDRA